MMKTTGTLIPVLDHPHLHLHPFLSSILITPPSSSSSPRIRSQQYPTNTSDPRIRHILHLLRPAQRIPRRAPRRATRHHPRRNAPQRVVQVQRGVVVGQERAAARRQDAVGGQHERAATRRAVGARVQRGADDCRAGARRDDEPEGSERGTLMTPFFLFHTYAAETCADVVVCFCSSWLPRSRVPRRLLCRWVSTCSPFFS